MSPSPSTPPPPQYDTIQGPYDYTRTRTIALIERENAQSVVAPLLRNGGHVLELACGSGFYTEHLLQWGASSIVAVDASKVMLEAARRRLGGGRVVVVKPGGGGGGGEEEGIGEGNGKGKGEGQRTKGGEEKEGKEDETASSLHRPEHKNEPSPPIHFLQADCLLPTPYLTHLPPSSSPSPSPSSPSSLRSQFDLIFAAWLINYAPDLPTLISLFTNISLNLRPGGHFIGITCPPSPTPLASMQAEIAARPPPGGSGLLNYRLVEELDDGSGVFFEVFGDTPVGEVRFRCWHLKQSMIDGAVREGGLQGRMEWVLGKVPGRYFEEGGEGGEGGWEGGKGGRGEGREGEGKGGEGKWEGGASREELESYERAPDYGILVVEK